MDTLQIERVPLDSLHPDPANARAHGPRNLRVQHDHRGDLTHRPPFVGRPATLLARPQLLPLFEQDDSNSPRPTALFAPCDLSA